jgi:hypothetical protein
LRSAQSAIIPTLPRFDERIQIGSIHKDAAQRLPPSIPFARAQGWHVDDRDQALEDVVPRSPEAASQVLGRLSHV